MEKNTFLYLEWLRGLINEHNHNHHILTEALFMHDFNWSVLTDYNRAKDGLEFREDFTNESGLSLEPDLTHKCSVLEMLIALAARYDDLIEDPIDGKEALERPHKWFWMMISNAGLYRFTDKYCVHWDSYTELEDKIDDILNRRYGKDGVGGFFPLKYPQKNQQNVDLWYQMNAYIMENHFL